MPIETENYQNLKYDGLAGLYTQIQDHKTEVSRRLIDDATISARFGCCFALNHAGVLDIPVRSIETAAERIMVEIESGLPDTHPYFERNLQKNPLDAGETVYPHKERIIISGNGHEDLPKTFCRTIFNGNELGKLYLGGNSSVIAITMSGCGQRVEDLMASILENSFQEGFSLIIVVNGTYDDTVKKIEENISGSDIPVIVDEIPPFETERSDGMTRNRLSQNLVLAEMRKAEVSPETVVAFIEDDILFKNGSLEDLKNYLLQNEDIRVTGSSIIPYPKEFLGEEKVHPVFYDVLTKLYQSMGKSDVPCQPHVHGSVIVTRFGDHPEIIEAGINFTDGFRSAIGLGNDGLTLATQRCPSVQVYHNEATSLALWRERWRRMLFAAQQQPRPKAISKAAAKQRDILERKIYSNLRNSPDDLAQFIIMRAAMHFNLPWQYC